MKKLPLILIILVLAGSSCWYCVRNNGSDHYKIVTLYGAEACYKATNPFIQVTNNPDGYSALPLSDKELIGLSISKDDFVYRYLKSDGISLKFRSEGKKLFLNDRVVSATISEDPDVLSWFNGLTAVETKNLRQIVISDSLSADCQGALKKLAGINPGLGFFFDSDNIRIPAGEILELFDPSYIFGRWKAAKAGMDRIYSLKELELLEIMSDDFDIGRLSRLKKLKSLFITDFNLPDKGEKLDFPAGLKSLTFIQPKIENLEFLGRAEGLEEFNLVGCDSVHDLGPISGWKNLSRIGLPVTSLASNLTEISRIPSIRGFSFPANITVDDFSRFISMHNKLETIELTGCEYLRNLEPLKNLSGLSCLSILSDTLTADKLFALKQLDYLSFQMDLPKDSVKMRDLKNHLPNTVIVPSKGLCLGSGWILLAFPFLILFGIVSNRTRRRVRV